MDKHQIVNTLAEQLPLIEARMRKYCTIYGVPSSYVDDIKQLVLMHIVSALQNKKIKKSKHIEAYISMCVKNKIINLAKALAYKGCL